MLERLADVVQAVQEQVPPERVHIMLDFKAPWVTVPTGPGEVHFARYPDYSLEDWHRRHGLWVE